MQHIVVDFSRVLADDRVEVGFADESSLCGYTLHEGERVVLYETGLEVEGVLQQETRLEKSYWYAIPDWAIRKDTDVTPHLQAS